MNAQQRRLRYLLLVAVAWLVAVGLGVMPAAAAKNPATKVCHFNSTVLPEVSGMTPGIRHKGILWVHNGVSGGPVIYGIEATTCKIRAKVTLEKVPGRDIEAIASGRDANGEPVLWIGDLGDAKEAYPYVRLYQLPEPAELTAETLPVRTWRFAYPDGPHNAEALIADPRSPRLWVVTKQLSAGVIYQFPDLPDVALGEVVETPLKLTAVGDSGELITDGAESPDGSRFVLRDLVKATIYAGLPPGKPITTIDMPTQPQGRAISWASGGRALLAAGTNEGTLWSVPLPEEAWTAAAQRAAAGTAGDGEGRSTWSTALLVLVGILAIVVVIAIVRGRQRERANRRRWERR